MQSKLLSKNLFFVTFCRLISLVSNVAVGLLLPKIFSITDYGFFKVFTLYAVYMTLLHFGFVDGLLLKLAGKNYCDLNREKMRTYTRFFVVFELIISFVIILMGAILAKGEYFFIVIMLAFNMVFVNITTYYQFVSQAVQRFGEYSAKSLIVSFTKLIFVCGLFGIYFFDIAEVSYRVYLMGLNLLDLFMTLWYVAAYRDITFGKGTPVSTLKKDIFGIFKTGIVLTMAYQVSHLVLVLDRQFVNILFSPEIFAVYSFAYNIVSMISTMISSFSIVLLPMLKKSAKEYIVECYKKSIKMVSIVTAGALMCYFPLVSFIKWFLPNYSLTLEYIEIVLPTLLFTSGINVVMFTVEKVFDTSLSFFKDSCVILVIGFAANTVAYIFFKSPQAISYASLFVMAIWFLIEGISLGRRVGVKVYREFTYLAIISVGFIAVTKFVENPLLGLTVFGTIYVAFTLLFYFQFLKENAFEIIKKSP